MLAFAIESAVNVGVNMIVAGITGQEYTLMDAVLTVGMTALSKVKKLEAIIDIIDIAFTGVSAGIASYSRGEQFGTALMDAEIAMFGAWTSGKLLGGMDDYKVFDDVIDKDVGLILKTYTETVIGTGIDLITSVTTIGVDSWSENRPETAKSTKKRNKTTPKARVNKRTGKNKCKCCAIVSGGCSTDYYRYLYNGGTPF